MYQEGVGSGILVLELAILISFTSYRFSRDRPRFMDTLDMIKFLCKDMWTLLFRKQIDNLKTNHRVRRPVQDCEAKAD